MPVCGGVGEEGSGSEAKEASKSIEIPAVPVIAASTTSVECEMGEIATALNGVSIYSGAVDNSCNKVDVDSSSSEWVGFDMCDGHSQNSGDYHYHFPPSCLIQQATTANSNTIVSAGHSPQIGWVWDGFPIYGPVGVGGNKILNPSCSGSYCADACGGIEEEITSLDGFKYRYYLTGEVSDLVSLPADPKPAATDYPFTINCYKGCTWSELSRGTCTGSTDGTATDYTAEAHAGHTDVFTEYASGSTKQCAQSASLTSTISLVGIESSAWDTTAQDSFKTVLASNAGTVCGTSLSTVACTAADVTISSRRDVSVTYTLAVATSSLNTAISTVNTYTASAAFVTDLNAASIAVSAVTIVSDAAATSSTESSDDTDWTLIILMCLLAFAVCVGAAFGVYKCYFEKAEKFGKMEQASAQAV